ncbi:hypothetical protein [Bacillus basilensis]|uniref:hypothetical protein n=1 Tax=Bacillus basilensis TaxID=3243721 RepID=UPI003D651B0F
MQDFMPGDFLIGSVLKNKSQEIFTNLSSQNLKFAVAYREGHNYSKNNVGIASLQQSAISQKEVFVAFNNVNIRNDISLSDRSVLKNSHLTLCLKDEKTLPVRRLGINNLAIYIPKKLGYADSKSHCTERKILSKILRMMKKKKSHKDNSEELLRQTKRNTHYIKHGKI